MKLRIAVAIAVSIVLTSLAAIGTAEEAGSGKGSDNGASATAATVQALKRGGFVLYMRHTSSDTSKPDRVPNVDFNDCATQRPLSSEGRRQAAQIGKAVRSLGIPIGEVRVSPYCRTKETAELAFGSRFIVEPSLASTSNLTDAQKAPLLQDLRRWLAEPVRAGTNRVLISHNAPLMDAIGIFPRLEGGILVFRPDGNGGFAHVATMAPTDWDRLAAGSR
jgi:phosphohistidine phosphatase SixA